MADPRIVQSTDLRMITEADWRLMPSGNLDEREELCNYVKVALMSDRVSTPGEILPDPDSTDRRGWWGDLDAQAIWNGWPIGSKCWLLMRAKIADSNSFEGDTVVRAESYCRDALQPLIDMRLCTAIDVEAARTGIDRIDVAITVFRGPEPEIQLIFQDMWRQLSVYEVLSPYGSTV
jgi:phage gp46-like protein